MNVFSAALNGTSPTQVANGIGRQNGHPTGSREKYLGDYRAHAFFYREEVGDNDLPRESEGGDLGPVGGVANCRRQGSRTKFFRHRTLRDVSASQVCLVRGETCLAFFGRRARFFGITRETSLIRLASLLLRHRLEGRFICLILGHFVFNIKCLYAQRGEGWWRANERGFDYFRACLCA